ncbi:MAG: hypothetical protein KatS3mg129_3037 [Leptospiraceae bacterium]|nr:MAG: hypothetical protein KatS3mg129_3037 [Leptospiraceae bacterium]
MSKRWKPPFEKDKQARLFTICAYDSEHISYIEKVKKKLEGFFGKIDFEIHFNSLLPVPSIYAANKEFDVYHLISFERPVGREELVDIKIKTLSIELRYQKDGFPIIEIDSGYVTENQVIRTSLYEENHKIYLYKKVFAETLYYFDKGSFKPFIHTPKFFRSPDIITTFNDLRLIYVSSS